MTDTDPQGPGATLAERGALLSDDGRYRYRLWRNWDAAAPIMIWVMLNPSTADALQDDPTIRKCIGFAKARQHGGIVVVNLFAWRATNPKELPTVTDPIGPENDEHIYGAINRTRPRRWSAAGELKSSRVLERVPLNYW